MMENGSKNAIVEALILASPEPLMGRKIADVIDDMSPSKVSQAVAQLNETHAVNGSAYRIREIAGGYQFYILPEYTTYVEELFTRRRKMRLTRASLETLAIVAYKQPVTKNDIEHIRGVASDGVIHNLLEKKMVTIKGRAETVGKPLQYATTDEFLKFFGLNSLNDMPRMAEIEEMLSVHEARNQTELSLDLHTQFPEKLNIADGTYKLVDDEDETEKDSNLEVESDLKSDTDEEEKVLTGEPLPARDLEIDDEIEDDEVFIEEQPEDSPSGMPNMFATHLTASEETEENEDEDGGVLVDFDGTREEN